MHTKMSLNVRHRVVSPAGIAERTCIYPNQAQTLARERVTRQPPTLDCGSTSRVGEDVPLTAVSTCERVSVIDSPSVRAVYCMHG